jgi:hypothetical protein
MLGIGLSGVLRYKPEGKVADYCDPSFAGTLTRVNSLEQVCKCVLPPTTCSL